MAKHQNPPPRLDPPESEAQTEREVIVHKWSAWDRFEPTYIAEADGVRGRRATKLSLRQSPACVADGEDLDGFARDAIKDAVNARTLAVEKLANAFLAKAGLSSSRG